MKTMSRSVGTTSVLGACVAVALGSVPAVHAAETSTTTQPLEEVIVTGFRKSLEDSTTAKRESVGFIDSIFAEDIGKFPDTNIAESFQRIPGIQISREISGEGTTVAIRGLNTNFTKVTLNDAPVAIASATQEGSTGNREVMLDLFPTELFSNLSVAKTASAEMLEGGAAGTVNMRMARPFDNEGMHLTYSIQGIDTEADDMGGRGSIIASGTWGSFGALVGIAGVKNKVETTGFESVGWSSLSLSAAQCGPAGAPCNTTGGNGTTPPATVPDNASTRALNLTPGETIDQAWLLAHNPGLTIQQIDNAIMPRLGRPMFEVGDKDRYNAIASFEFRPSEDLHVFLDSMYGKQENEYERVDMMFGMRSGSQGGRIIPLNMTVDKSDCSRGCTVMSGTFANSDFFLEYRPYTDETEFWGTNPGLSWQIAERLKLDVQGNYTKSEFYRESPTVLVISDTTTATFVNGEVPTITSSVDINDPASFQWLTTDRAGTDVGRVNMQDEKRDTETMGARFAVTWGEDTLNLKMGGAYDEISRDIRPFGNDAMWSAATCGGNPGNFQLAPNGQPACRGETAGEITAGVNGYPTYAAPYGGSLIPNAAVPSYLRPTQYGFITVDWNSFRRDSNYDAIHDAILESASTPTTAQWGSIDEAATGLFLQLNGDTEIGTNRFRYNVGVRWVETDQTVTSRVALANPDNPALPDGQKLPDIVNIIESDKTYENWLPAANLAWNITDNAVVRAGLSKTMTRANPTDMLLGVAIRNADVSQVDVGNPELEPYLSDNMDLGFEYYTGQEGYFGVAAFRKGIEGFTQRLSQNVTFADLAQYGITLDSLSQAQRDSVIARGGQSAFVELRQTVNASGRLTINGLEFNWVQPLDFLLGGIGLDGFGFTANYTIIDQKGEGAAPAIAIGVPPESYNATFYYDNHGVSARISVTHSDGSQGTGPNSNQNGVVGAELFGDDYTQWDFSSSFDFSEMFGVSGWVPQLTVDVINIGEEKRRTYNQFQNATYTIFDSGRTVLVGLRGRF